MAKTDINSRVNAVILAGGTSLRMGNTDKGLQTLYGKPLTAWVAAQLNAQGVNSLFINANKNKVQYAKLGYSIIPDLDPQGSFGPLAGLQAMLEHLHAAGITDSFVLTVPCDTPCFPSDLVSQLYMALQNSEDNIRADAAIVKQGSRPQPIFCLYRQCVAKSLGNFLAQDERKILKWHESLNCTQVDFEDSTTHFFNINTPDELLTAEKLMIPSLKEEILVTRE